MVFKHAAFISYRAGRGSEVKPGVTTEMNPYIEAIREFRQHLINELLMLLEPEMSTVFLDRDNLVGGEHFDKAMATALCQSVCMILIYTPQYFSKVHPYCTREFCAMEDLERRRFEKLGAGLDPRYGLIIPVALRYKDRMPKHIRGRRQCYDFPFLQKEDGSIQKHPTYLQDVNTIAGYIFERYLALASVGDEPCDCAGYELPTEDAALAWLDKLNIA
jgi:hypothetical protein